MNFLFDSAVTVREAILKRWRRKRAPTRSEIQAGKMFSDNGPQLPHQIFHNAIQDEDQLEKSTVSSNDEFYDDDDDDQETSSKKRKLDHDFYDIPSSETAKIEMSSHEDLPMLCNDSEEDDRESVQNKRKLDDILPETNEIASNKKRKLDEEGRKEVTDESGMKKPLDEEVRMKILQKAQEGGEENVKAVLVIEKVLRKSDVDRGQNRLAIPLNQMENMFLSSKEIRHLRKMHRTSRTNHMDVPVIEPSGKVGMLALRRWNVGQNGVSYVINGGGWKDVVGSNRLKQGQTVQVWAFRVQGQLNFAFVFLPN